MTQKRYYITTPIYYVNGSPHIGHAYTSIAADVMARFKRIDGYDVFFATGTDEHGQKVEKSALDAQTDPQSFADRISAEFRQLCTTTGISNTDFIRTTEERHKKACRALWERLAERGYIYLGEYEGWYATRDEAFYGEDELIRQPDGSFKAPSGAPVELVKEPSYFFKLSAMQEPLLDFYAQHPDFVAPQARRNELLNFIKGGLSDLSVSRTGFKWGVPVPGDEAHVMYVWLDALTNYLSVLGFPDETVPDFAFWPADLHLVGKEISRFHALYWPAFLMAAGLPVPKRVFSHGWWTAEGEKMSKSLGNVINPTELIQKFGLDQIRYFLLREVPFGNDGDFSEASLINRINSELANDLGNLAQRVLSIVAGKLQGRRPKIHKKTAQDEVLLDEAHKLIAAVRQSIDKQALHEALDKIFTVIRAGNTYVDRQAPWSLAKTDPERMETVLAVLCETLRVLATLLQPYMPESMLKLLHQLGVEPAKATIAALDLPLPEGQILPAPEGIFPRFGEKDRIKA